VFLNMQIVNQTAFIVSYKSVTELQFIRIKTELVYIGRRRTTSFNENDTRVNKTCKYNTSNKKGNSNTKTMSGFWPTMYMQSLKIPQHLKSVATLPCEI